MLLKSLVGNNGCWDSSNSEGGRDWLNSEYVLKQTLKGFAYGIDVGLRK